jgi:hypothetical protein
MIGFWGSAVGTEIARIQGVGENAKVGFCIILQIKLHAKIHLVRNDRIKPNQNR